MNICKLNTIRQLMLMISASLRILRQFQSIKKSASTMPIFKERMLTQVTLRLTSIPDRSGKITES